MRIIDYGFKTRSAGRFGWHAGTTIDLGHWGLGLDLRIDGFCRSIQLQLGPIALMLVAWSKADEVAFDVPESWAVAVEFIEASDPAGKSQVMREAAERFGVPLFDIPLSAYDEVDWRAPRS